jgi:hypothetical protein
VIGPNIGNRGIAMNNFHSVTPTKNFTINSWRIQMPAKSINRFFTFSFARTSIALLLTALLLLPDGVAMAQTCTSTSWNTSTSQLPNPIETLNAVVNSGYLYVVGGYTAGATLATGTFRNTVDYVQLSTSDGSLMSNFALTSAQLPVPLSRDLCGVAYKGYLYAVGGVESTSGTGYGTTTKAVRRGNINLSTGDVNGWISQTSALQEAVQLHGVAAVTVGTTGYLYVIGGSLGTDIEQSQVTGNITNHVWYAPINSVDGSVGTFTRTADLPIKLYKTCPAVVNGTIYMSGGETNANPSAVNSVYYATPNSTTGAIDSWAQSSASLPNTLASQAVAYVNTKGIVLMGGDQSGSGMDRPTVYEGVVSSPGSITWNTLASLPNNISRNAGATLNHYAYSVGGLEAGSDSQHVHCKLIQ